jgi:hypothetical protein
MDRVYPQDPWSVPWTVFAQALEGVVHATKWKLTDVG